MPRSTHRQYVLVGMVVVIAILGVSYNAFFRNNNSSDGRKTYRIAVVSLVEIEPIVQLRAGFRERLEGSEFATTHELAFTDYNAQGDNALVNQIVDKLAVDPPDLVFVLGTPAAQAIQKRIPEVLLVQGAVTDPIAAGLARSWDGSGRKYLATSDLPPVEEQIKLIRLLTPATTRVGIVYNSGEVNSVAVVSRFRDQAPRVQLPLKLVERQVDNTAGVATAVQSLVGNVDVIYLPPDNTVFAAVKVVGKFANENRIPIFASARPAIEGGALATLSLDYKELGKESADLALAALAGRDPATTPIRLNQSPQITISAKVARLVNVDLAPVRNNPRYTIVE